MPMKFVPIDWFAGASRATRLRWPKAAGSLRQTVRFRGMR